MGMQGSKSLIAGYPFEGTANDVMQAHDGVWTGTAVYDDGVFGAAASFDRTSVVVDASVKSTLQNQISISLFIKPIAFNAIQGIIASSGGSKGFTIRYSSNANQLDIYIGKGTSYAFLGTPITHGFVLNQWNYLCVTYDGLKLRTYVNCILISELSDSFIPNWGLTTDMMIASRAIIDNVKIYNKALTQSEIQRDYLNLPIF